MSFGIVELLLFAVGAVVIAGIVWAIIAISRGSRRK